MQRKIKIYLVLFMSLLFLGLSLSKAQSALNPSMVLDNLKITDKPNVMPTLNDVNATLMDRPILAVEKSINATPIAEDDTETFLIRPKTWIRVNVSISNVGNQSAYNLTISDPSFSSWAFGSLNLTTQRFVQVDVNATIFYFYYFQPNIEGNFTLLSTEVTYINGTGEEYFSSSQSFNLYILAEEIEYSLEVDLWVNILLFSLAVIAFLGAVVLIDRYLIQKPETRAARRKRRRTVITEKEKSKREVKKKIEKRR